MTELNQKKTYYLSITFLVFATFFWGSTFVLVKETVSIVPIEGFLSVRFLLASIFLLLILLLSDWQQVRELANPAVLKYGFILGTILFLSFIFQTIGLSLTTPAKAAFITGLNVLFVPVFSGLPPYNKGVKRVDIVLAAMAFLGLGLMTLDFSNLSVQFGDAIIILTAMAIAYHIIITDDAVRVAILPLLVVQLFTVSTESYLLSVVRGTTWNPLSGSYPPIVWGTVIITSLLASSFAMWAQTFAQKNHVKGAKVALIFTFEPIFALLIDIILGIIPTVPVFIGMVIILVVTIYSLLISES